MNLKSLRPGLLEVIAQNYVHQFRLGDLEFIGCPLCEFLIIICDDDLFVFLGERPRAYLANQGASPAGMALHVIALLAERLPIAKIIRAVPGSRDFVVRAEFDIRFLCPTRGTSVSVAFLNLLPFSLAGFSPWFFLLAYVQTLQLVAGAFFFDRSKAFIALQLPHTPENVFVGWFSLRGAESIHGGAEVVFGQRGPGMPCPARRRSREGRSKRIRGRREEESATLNRTANLRNQFCGAFTLEQTAQDKRKHERSANCEYDPQESEHGMECSGAHKLRKAYRVSGRNSIPRKL
jgi:hypothetical protein